MTTTAANWPTSVQASGGVTGLGVTIRDDESTLPRISLSTNTSSPVTEGGTVTVTVSLTAQPATDVSYSLKATDGYTTSTRNGVITDSQQSVSQNFTMAQDTDYYNHDGVFRVWLDTVSNNARRGSPLELSWTVADDEAPVVPTVSLTVAPTTVNEGSDTTVTVTLSSALSPAAAVDIPIAIRPGTAENGDWSGVPDTINIASGATSGTGTITAAQDADSADETITVSLGGRLPSVVRRGSPQSATVTIDDDEASSTLSLPDDNGGGGGGGGGIGEVGVGDVGIQDEPTVDLSASPNPVMEGQATTVTATLSSALAADVSIPVTLTAGTAEDGDYGELSAIVIRAGQTTGTGEIATNEDTDADDETFTVALGTLPAEVTAGGMSSVEIVIRDAMPVPALPAVAQLLLAAFLAAGGCRRYLRRRR